MVWDVNTATQWGMNQGYLKPGEIAQGGLLNSRVAAAGGNAQTNYEAAMRAANQPVVGGQGGFVPMTAEPLHQFEKTGLQTIANPGLAGGGSMVNANKILQEMQANPQAFAAKYTNPQATEYMGKAGDYTTRGAAPITLDEVLAVENPFTDALKNRLSEAGERARAAVTANQGLRGGRSFGDISTGKQLGMLEQEQLSKSSDIDWQGFQDAKTMLENMRNRSLNAGGQFGNLATGAQGIASDAMRGGLSGIGAMYDAGQGLTNQALTNAQNQVGAGRYIRDYNQNINDMIGSDILTGQAYPANQISQVLNWLKSYESGTAGATPGANSLETAGGLLGAGGSLANYFRM